MEYWKIQLWENVDGVCRIERDLLKKMRKKESFLYRSLEEKMGRYTESLLGNVQTLGELEKVKGETTMWELKFHLLKCEIRFLGCMVLEDNVSVFYALYGFRKKDQQIKSQHINTARTRVKEFLGQYNYNGLQKIL